MKISRFAKYLAATLLLQFGLALAQEPPPADVTPDSSAPAAQTTAPRTEAPVEGLVRKDADTIAFTVPEKHLSPVVHEGPLEIGNFDFNGEPVPTSKIHLRQLSPGVYEITSVAYSVGYWRFHIEDWANYYGFGERFDTLNRSHTIVRNASQDNGYAKGSSSSKPIPFFMSTTGYGLWLDTTSEATFDMNATSDEDIVVDCAASKLRIVLFAGPKFSTILERFTALEGRAILPPYWAFAPWKAWDHHESQAAVDEDVDKTRELGLPGSVILIGSPWATGSGTYKFDPTRFDDAPAMVKHLHDEGFKLVLEHSPWIERPDDKSDIYDETKSSGYFVKTYDGATYVGRWRNGEGSPIDFTNPSAKRWWQDQVRLAIAAGADGFKDDDGEGSFLGPVKFADGSDPRTMRNKYAVLYNDAVEELIQKDLKGNGVLLARTVTTGANGIGLLWGGKNEASFSPENGLPTVVTAGLNAGLSGEPMWTADLGGYRETGTPDAPLPMRWTEYAAFSPVMEGSDKSAGPAAALANYKRYAILHMSLFPYRYAAAQESARTGMPIMRALVLEYQDDERARQAKDEYLFGPDLLVAPVIDEAVSRPVYLPGGDWINLFSGEKFEGGKVVLANAPLDTIPVYARLGTILPMIPEDVMTLVPQAESGNAKVKSMDDRRVYELVGPAAASATSITDFEGRTVVRSGDSLTIEGDSVAHVIVRWRFAHPRSATRNGKAMSVKTDAHGDAFVEFDYTGSTSVAWQ
jgi:alpha-D-xyloside xylohydrolase